MQKQIESLFLLKELPSSLEWWPCGAEKPPSARQRSGPTTRSWELPLQYGETERACERALAQVREDEAQIEEEGVVAGLGGRRKRR